MGGDSEYIDFVPRPTKGKTQRWSVETVAWGAYLGEIRWKSSWRKYAFFPDIGTCFEETCWDKIADFLRQETAKQRATWKRPPKPKK